jgi:hypothetical protein
LYVTLAASVVDVPDSAADVSDESSPQAAATMAIAINVTIVLNHALLVMGNNLLIKPEGECEFRTHDRGCPFTHVVRLAADRVDGKRFHFG